MTARRLLLVGVAAAGLAVAGAGMTSALMDLPDNDLLDLMLSRREPHGEQDRPEVHEVLALLTGLMDELGERGQREGAYFGWWNFAAKLNLALAAGLALPLWLLCTIAGGLLVFLWGFSTHYAAWANRNLLLLSPLCLLLLPGAISLLRRRVPGRMFRIVLWLVAVQAVAALVLHWLSLQAQYNVQWIVLLLPVHAALA